MPAEQRPPSGGPGDPLLAGRSVLVVDDDPTVREVARAYLEHDGFTVHTAADAFEALERADALHPDILVLDRMLPGIDGLDVCRRVRAVRPEVPVIMLTALGAEQDRIEGLEASLRVSAPAVRARRSPSRVRRSRPTTVGHSRSCARPDPGASR